VNNMIEENNINFIEDLEPIENNISTIQELPVNQNSSGTTVTQNADYIKELPKWDINPPLEINRGEQ